MSENSRKLILKAHNTNPKFKGTQIIEDSRGTKYSVAHKLPAIRLSVKANHMLMKKSPNKNQAPIDRFFE